jgi:2,4-dienoyl-CoA reductase-like NADH-dependent reductase (Old Yellow Enzyme family)
MSTTDPLLQPFQLKHLSLRNRVLGTAHEPAYSEDAKPKERYVRYHEEKARGGVAVSMFGGSACVAPDSPAAFGNLYVGDDDIIPWFQTLSERVHAQGAGLMCQITHLGRRTYWNREDWLPTISPSPIREPAHRSFPKAMEHFDIHRVVQAYAEAARRCQEGGLDGVEIEAYGHLLDAFWSPATNRREDEYGGSLENRMRFGMQVLEAIRRAVGEDYIVGFRMVMDEDMDGGLSADEGLAIARTLVGTGSVDFINVIRGHIDTDEGLSHVIPGMGTPAGPHLDFVRRVREALDIPIFHASRINDVATARHALREGCVDMVGMTRALMADPYFVAKIQAGEEERIRPCVGAGYCIDRIYEGGDALCIHNAATGRESFLPQRISPGSGPRRRVVVVGAGPAGLEAARVMAERGHQVTVLEATDELGGQIQLAARVARRKEIIGIVDWLGAELERLAVELRFGCYAQVEDVLRLEPEVVIVATGGVPNTSFLSAGEDLVATSWDVLSGELRTQPGESVMMYDDNGQHPGISCAEFLANQGLQLELVTPDRMVGAEIGGTNLPGYLKALYEKNVRMTVNHRLRAVRREGGKLVATLYNEYPHLEVERQVDRVVVEHGTLPMDELYFELVPHSVNGGEVDLSALIGGRAQTLRSNSEGRFQLFRIGDAVASRNIHAAMYDALRLCVHF